jgi:hypothetical protein
MKTLNLEQMGAMKGGNFPKWLECAGAAVGTVLFFSAICVTTGPIGLYAANAILGPTVVGIGWAACAD